MIAFLHEAGQRLEDFLFVALDISNRVNRSPADDRGRVGVQSEPGRLGRGRVVHFLEDRLAVFIEDGQSITGQTFAQVGIGAVPNNDRFDRMFFTQVDFRGGMGPNTPDDWAAGWTTSDPN